MGKPTKHRKLYREAGMFQDYVSYLLAHLTVPNSLDSTQAIARGICGQFIEHVSSAYIQRIRNREHITGAVPFPSKAYDTIASIVSNRKKYRSQVRVRMEANVFKG